MMLFELPRVNGLIEGVLRRQAQETIKRNHYLHNVSSAKSHYVAYEDAIVVWSIPPNSNISTFMLGKPNALWELSRLWAPDGHRPNLLTQAISFAVKELKRIEPDCGAVIAYADPNAGHHGGVYLAASWMFCGQSEESRYYMDKNGQSVARRTYVRGKQRDTTHVIAEQGIHCVKRPGKLRFAFPLKKWARKALLERFGRAEWEGRSRCGE